MISRRWPDTILLAVLALGIVAWAAGLRHSTVFGAAVAALCGLVFLALAVLGPASGPCPACGEILHGLFALPVNEYERCPRCARYFRRSDLKEVPTDHVAAIPQFAVPIGEGESLPDLCCVCGGPAARTLEIVYSKVKAPYCGRHDGGVAIVSEDFAASVPLINSFTGSPPSEHRRVLKVRSYAFYREAVL